MTLKYSDHSFLTLSDAGGKPLKPTYGNRGSCQLPLLDSSPNLCAKAVRAIPGHAPTDEYRVCFLPQEAQSCKCGSPSQTRAHILYERQLFKRSHTRDELMNLTTLHRVPSKQSPSIRIHNPGQRRAQGHWVTVSYIHLHLHLGLCWRIHPGHVAFSDSIPYLSRKRLSYS